MTQNRRTLRHARQLRIARLGRGIGHRRRFRTVTDLAASRVQALPGAAGDDVVTRPVFDIDDYAAELAALEEATEAERAARSDSATAHSDKPASTL